jgi:hypothetical protein
MSKSNPLTSSFDRLVVLLINHGYSVKVTSESKYTTKEKSGVQRMVKMPRKHNYRFAMVKGKGIEAGFCEPNDGSSYYYIDGKITADNAECFNKWSQCPLCLDFPSDSVQEAKLLELLTYLGSREGFKYSNDFDYLDEANDPYHY